MGCIGCFLRFVPCLQLSMIIVNGPYPIQTSLQVNGNLCYDIRQSRFNRQGPQLVNHFLTAITDPLFKQLMGNHIFLIYCVLFIEIR